MTSHFASRIARLLLAFALLAVLTSMLSAQAGYQKPPKEILDILNAPGTPQESISPTRDAALLITVEPYPPISDISQPFARVAGVRIDIATNGAHNQPRVSKIVIKKISDGSEKKVVLPPGFYSSRPTWAPDGKHFYFTHATENSIELW